MYDDAVAETDDRRLWGDGFLGAPGMSLDPVSNGIREVQPGAVALEHVDDAERVLVVPEPQAEVLRQAVVERLLADVTERRMPEIVPEPDRLGQVLVEAQGAGDGTRDLGDLERVREPSSVVVAAWQHEHLGLVAQPPERLAVDDPVAVALERSAQTAVVLRALPQRRVGPGRVSREVGLLAGLDP